MIHQTQATLVFEIVWCCFFWLAYFGKQIFQNLLALKYCIHLSTKERLLIYPLATISPHKSFEGDYRHRECELTIGNSLPIYKVRHEREKAKVYKIIHIPNLIYKIFLFIKGSLDEKLPIYERDPKSKRIDS